MRVTILSVGSRGDVQPFVALGLGLQAKGYVVRLATHSVFESLVRSADLDFFAIEGNPKEILFSQSGQKMLKSGRQTVKFMRQAVKAFEPVLEQLADDCWRACETAEAIIFTPFTFFGYDLAQKLSIPAVATCLQPAIPTRHFPSPAFPQGMRLGRLYNRLTHTVSEYGFWHIVQPYLNRLRQDKLGLPAVSAWRDRERRRAPVVHGYSSFVLPKPPDWGERAHVTGFWFLEREDVWRPSSRLQKFLADGPAPVYVGFGSMLSGDADETTIIVAKALQEAKQRGIVVTGWGGLTDADVSPDIYVAKYIPFDWLFPQVAAVVHHGGAGTLAEGLRAGRPTVVCPLAGDQPFWGEVVAGLGAGPQPIPFHKLRPDTLAKAIEICLKNSEMQATAADLGRRLSREDGVGEAVGIIHKYLARI